MNNLTNANLKYKVYRVYTYIFQNIRLNSTGSLITLLVRLNLFLSLQSLPFAARVVFASPETGHATAARCEYSDPIHRAAILSPDQEIHRPRPANLCDCALCTRHHGISK